MGVNNQVLCGGACVGIVVLVVAMDAPKTAVPIREGEGNPPPPDIPGQTDVDALLKDVETQATRWHQNRALASAEDVKIYLRDARLLRSRGRRMFKTRATFYAVDPLKVNFDTRMGAVIDEIIQQSAGIHSERTVTEEVPVHAEASINADQDTTLAGAFNQTSWSTSAHDVPEGHQTTPVEFDNMVDEFAHQETGVAPTDREKSGFKTSPDPLNDAPSKPDSAAKIADQDNVAGYENAPTTAVPSIPEPDDKPKTDAPNFDTVEDEEVVDPLPEGTVEQPEISHEEVLTQKAAQAKLLAKAAFNTTNEPQLGADDFATKLARLRQKLVEEFDPEASGELQSQVDDVLRQIGTAPTPEYETFSKALYGWVVKVNQYDRKLNRSPDPKKVKDRMERMNYYAFKIESVKTTGRMLRLKQQTLAAAQATYARNLKKFPQKKKREAPKTGIHKPKRQKTGSEAVRAAAGRQSQTGEPPRKKSARTTSGTRRSTRLKPVKDEPEEQAPVSDAFNT